MINGITNKTIIEEFIEGHKESAFPIQIKISGEIEDTVYFNVSIETLKQLAAIADK
jgi:hypothetical protein